MPTENAKGQSAFNKILKDSNLHENVVIAFLQSISKQDMSPEDFDAALAYADTLKVPDLTAPAAAAAPKK